jgi:hypothetical protein
MRLTDLGLTAALSAIAAIAIAGITPKSRRASGPDRIHVVHQSQAAHHFHISLGDLPTWLLFVGAIVAAGIALRQLRIQQKDSARGVRQLERQQADKVNFAWCQAGSVLFITPGNELFHCDNRSAVTLVSNGSERPIRVVTSHIRLPDGRTLDPIKLGVVTEDPPSSGRTYTMENPRHGAQAALIRPGFSYGFIFEFNIPDDDILHPERREAHPFTRFIDDADLEWEIDGDLHLKAVRSKRKSRNP